MNVIVEREKRTHELEARIKALRERGSSGDEVRALEERFEALLVDLFGNLSPWERVNMARHPKRPISPDYLSALDEFEELHGDRHAKDDLALVGGFAKLRDRRVMVLAQMKGRDTKENIKRNFGMASPEGYRKAKRLMELASRLRLPIVTFVDTSGADPGIASEEHGQSEALASCLVTLSKATVPVVSAIVGEGGSGGALALALADYVVMPENSVYSVASPEGCAAILWGDASRAEEAADRLKLTSRDLLGFGIADEIVSEPLGGAHRDADAFVASVVDALDAALRRFDHLDPEALRKHRYDKYRRIGAWQAGSQTRVSAVT